MKSNIQVWDKKSIKDYGRDKLKQELINHVKKSWCDPGHMADDWVTKSDALVTYRLEGGEIVGFATGVFIDNRTLNLNATILNKGYQNKGIANRLNLRIVEQFIKKHPLTVLTGFYIVVRTPNPILYESLVRNVGFYPDYRDPRRPKKWELGALRRFADFSTGIEYDEKNFIVRGILKKYPGFIYSIKDIPWSKNKTANDFIESRIELKGLKGNMIVMVARINIFSLITNCFRILT